MSIETISCRLIFHIVSNIKLVWIRKAAEDWDVAAEIVGGSMEKCKIGQLVNEALQTRRMQTETIQSHHRDCEAVCSPLRCRTIEASVGRLTADVVAGPSSCDILRVSSDGSLETLNNMVRAEEPLVLEILWPWVAS